MKYNELKKILIKHGCSFYKSGGNHDIWKAPNGKMFSFPRHQSKEVKNGTLKSILKCAGVE